MAIGSPRGRAVRDSRTRAVAIISRWAFQSIGLIRVEILAPVVNAASQRVAEKAGFSREGVLRSYRNIAGEQTDLIMYSLIASDLQPGFGSSSTHGVS